MGLVIDGAVMDDFISAFCVSNWNLSLNASAW